MNCLVCATPTRPGLANWHRTCPSCRYESAALQPSINDARSHGLINEQDREVALRHLRQDNFRTIVEHIARHCAPQASSLLDVGCAHGWFLEEAGKRFNVLGIEPDAAVGAQAAARGLHVRQGYFPDALAGDERFDVIVFNDVIEHIPDIGAALQACHQRLRPNGLLVLNLPSSRGFFYRLSKLLRHLGAAGPFERMWQAGLPSPHVHYFDARNLRSLLTRHGFVLQVDFPLQSLRRAGLLERLRMVGTRHPVLLYGQYLVLLCLIPLLHAFPSDILVGVFRKAEPSD
jgi:SAM-dependent methyltransferase